MTSLLHSTLSTLVACVVILIATGPRLAIAQTQQAAGQIQSAQYLSQVDRDLTIRKVAVLPVKDNLEGIYARPIENQLMTLVKTHHQWDFVEAEFSGDLGQTASLELEENPENVLSIVRNVDADAFIHAKASKGPNGISIRLNLFLKSDGKLLAQETLKDYPRFELADMQDQIKQMFKKLVVKIPYQGLIMSRTQNRVTVNIGKSDGLVKDQIVTVIQLIKANRHPKFNFLVSTEKEILGRVKILKVDETLSFGAIVTEKERGVIQRFAKVSGLDSVAYPEPEDLVDAAAKSESLADRTDADVVFGKEAREWVPTRQPSFGLVGLKLGLGTYNESMQMQDTTGTTPNNNRNLWASSTFYPNLNLFGELWLNPNWTIRAEIFQGVMSIPNPRPDSLPKDLNHQMSRYSLAGGYNFLLKNDFFGPKIQVHAGLMNYRMYIDDSTPRGFTTSSFSGLFTGVTGSIPVTEEKKWYAGATFDLTLFSSMSEYPVASGGSPKTSVTNFSFFVERKLSENMRLIGSVEFALYSATFSPGGDRAGEQATSLSQKHTFFDAGVAYLF